VTVTAVALPATPFRLRLGVLGRGATVQTVCRTACPRHERALWVSLSVQTWLRESVR
jgi:hypothetical protein